jgi:K+-transporting ATPase KdpF subunit
MAPHALSLHALSLDAVLGLGVFVLLLGYLLTALMRPERF